MDKKYRQRVESLCLAGALDYGNIGRQQWNERGREGEGDRFTVVGGDARGPLLSVFLHTKSDDVEVPFKLLL